MGKLRNSRMESQRLEVTRDCEEEEEEGKKIFSFFGGPHVA